MRVVPERPMRSRLPFNSARLTITESVVCSAYSPVTGLVPPGRPRRFGRTRYCLPFHTMVFGLLGTATRVRPGGRDVTAWFTRSCSPRAVTVTPWCQ
jgi:hypothetical protein